MPGIVVGVDGSGHSCAALEWAVRETAVRRAPLTVITVHQAPVGYLGGAVDSAQDHDLDERYRRTAQDAVNRVFARNGEGRPESVTVQSFNGPTTDALLAAARDADMLVVGSRGAGGFLRSLMGSVSSQVITRQANCRWSSSRRNTAANRRTCPALAARPAGAALGPEAIPRCRTDAED